MVNLTTLAEGITHLEFSVPVTRFKDDPTVPELTKDIQARVELSRSGQQVYVTGAFQADVKVPCSRCLEMINQTITSDFACDFRPAPSSRNPDEEIELTPDDLDIVWYHGNEINVTEQIRQNILINLPMQPLCKEDCLGLCTQCGANLNTHPCQCKTEEPSKPMGLLSGIRLSRNSVNPKK